MKPVTAALLCGALLFPHAAQSASFNCGLKTLKPDEKAICANLSLNDADVKMTTTFNLLSGLFAMGTRDAMKDQQTEWLAKRQACKSDTVCLKSAYDARMKQLDKVYNSINRPL